MATGVELDTQHDTDKEQTLISLKEFQENFKVRHS